MEKKTIAIIGGNGAMGTMFAEAWKKKGHKILISSRSTELNPIDAVKQADLVIVTVPISSTQQVIQDIGPFVKKDAILSDFTSVKLNQCKLMLLHSKSEVIGGHPVFGPGVDLKGQPFVICPARASPESIKMYRDLLESIGLNVIEMTAEDHDKEMAVIQCMNQLSNLSFANAIKNLKFDVNKQDLFSPAFLLKLNALNRMLSQDPALYAEIETYNPYAKGYAKRYLDSLMEIKTDIDKEDRESLKNKIKEMQAHFGKPKIDPTIATNKIISTMSKTHSGSSEKIAVLGPEYSYGHILALKSFTNADYVLCTNIEEIFKLVSEGKIFRGLAPIENMLNGSVRESIFSLKNYKVKINHMYHLPIHHCLASKSPDFKKIISHPQALAQCSKLLEKYKEKGVEIVETTSTSKAMELSSANSDYAALGSTNAAEHFKLKILNKDVEDNHHNVTSFILISMNENPPGLKGNTRTSILVVPDKDKPGLLYEILSAFKKNSVNLTKIESIPSGKKIGEYIFYIEFTGSLGEEKIQSAVDTIKALHDIYSLGSYEVEDIK